MKYNVDGVESVHVLVFHLSHTDYVSARNLYQGDIKMPSVADENNSPRMSEGEEAEAGTNVRTRRASTAVTSYLWPLGVIPYTIDSRIHQGGLVWCSPKYM